MNGARLGTIAAHGIVLVAASRSLGLPAWAVALVVLGVLALNAFDMWLCGRVQRQAAQARQQLTRAAVARAIEEGEGGGSCSSN